MVNKIWNTYIQMVRVSNLEESLELYCNHLGLVILKKINNAAGGYTLVFLGTSKNSEDLVELIYNWGPEVYTEGRNFGRLSFQIGYLYRVSITYGRKYYFESSPLEVAI